MLSSINAMYLFQFGDYRRAYEAASIAYTQYSRLNYVGIFGPLDSLFVMARCLLEFARPSEAHEKFVLIRDLAEKWKMWSWHFYADGYLARELAVNGQVTESIERIKSAHQRASQIDFSHQLDCILDLSEVFVRFKVNDLEKLGVLLERVPKFELSSRSNSPTTIEWARSQHKMSSCTYLQKLLERKYGSTLSMQVK